MKIVVFEAEDSERVACLALELSQTVLCRTELLLADHALLHHPNVFITPHIAYDTGEAMRRIIGRPWRTSEPMPPGPRRTSSGPPAP